MDTTTSEDGAVLAAQPTTNEAGTDDGAMVITTDESGTPTMVPVGQEKTEEPNAASTQDDTKAAEPEAAPVTVAKTEEAQANTTDSEIVEWAKKKGLEINPENPNEIKLARLQLDNDRRFHEAQQRVKVPVPELLEETEDPTLNAIVEKQNNQDLKVYVRDWFDANPAMKEHRQTLMQIAAERPYLQDMDDVAAHLYRDPGFVANLRQEGGRQALENLAQKQSAVPPQASASNTAVYSSDTQITPQNVYDLVDSNSQEWFEKNHDAVSKAMQGN